MKKDVNNAGFTLVEIMIVVAIIGILNVLVMPAFRKARLDSIATRVAEEFRVYSGAFTMQAAESGSWPVRRARGKMPPELEGFIRKEVFEEETIIGGKWRWVGPSRRQIRKGKSRASLDIRNIRRANRELLVRIDEILDDGDLRSGQVQGRGSSLSFILE